ncbi:hypothetical protein D3C73_769040 [compost metagenome]
MHNQSSSQAVSAKEFAYISDSMKNEDLLTKLCVQGAVESQSPSLKQTLAQISQDRLQNYNHLLNTLQQQSSMTH